MLSIYKVRLTVAIKWMGIGIYAVNSKVRSNRERRRMAVCHIEIKTKKEDSILFGVLSACSDKFDNLTMHPNHDHPPSLACRSV